MWNELLREKTEKPEAARGRRGAAIKKEKRYQEIGNPWGLSGAQVASLRALIAARGVHPDAASALHVSQKTLTTHFTRIREKMQAATLIEVILMFDRWSRQCP